MPARVTLTATEGRLKGQQFVFDDRATAIVGRAEGCVPQLPNDADHQTISRHHCLLDVNPPDVRIRDFGSLNGTFVNGLKIGQRQAGQTPEEAARSTSPEHDLRDGDEIRLGNTVLRVGVIVPAACPRCGTEVPAGDGLCQACRSEAEAALLITRPHSVGPAGMNPETEVHTGSQARTCVRCGGDVSREADARRAGDYLCAACRANPEALVQRLLQTAAAGAEGLGAIQGFRIVRELGRGGMGAVYLARHEASGEQVALKVMLPQVAADRRARERFLGEIEITRRLSHPAIVSLRHAGTAEGSFYFTLEYCPGGSVEDLLRRRGGTLPPGEAVPLIIEILKGLEYAHNLFGPGRGVIHRDLKPANLLLGEPGKVTTVKIADYGLSKAFDQAGLSGQTRTGATAGTPLFMPRQQVINFKHAKPEVDVWAAAASLYYLLTGAVPRDFVRGRDPWQTVLQNPAVPIRQRDAAVGPRLAEVIDLALVDQPRIHFQSAAELHEALAGAVA
jgi:hypothetical protein